MCNIVLIDKGTKRPTNNVNDIVDIYDDDVELGPAYSSFKILSMPGIPKSEILMVLNAARPAVRQAFKTTATAGEWSLEEPEQVTVWQDGETWKRLFVKPKYLINIDTGKVVQSIIEDTKQTKANRIRELQKGIACPMKTMAENQAVVTVSQVVDKVMVRS